MSLCFDLNMIIMNESTEMIFVFMNFMLLIVFLGLRFVKNKFVQICVIM
jgi:hypothetical protein